MISTATENATTSAAALAREVRRSQCWWRQQWLAFPTVSEHGDGLEFWDVPSDTGVYQDDWPRGERLARETIAQMRRFPEGASVLRRIVARLDPDSTVAQGFLNHLEEVLARPELYPPEPPTEG
jgi:hypothetical protein